MTIVVYGTFDGHVIVLDEPLDLPPNTRVRVKIEAIEPPPEAPEGASDSHTESP